MKYKPVGKRVLLKPYIPEETLPSGIVIPMNMQGRSNYATVEAVGEEITNLKVGDKVFHNKLATEAIKNRSTNDEEMYIFDIDNILAVVTD